MSKSGKELLSILYLSYAHSHFAGKQIHQKSLLVWYKNPVQRCHFNYFTCHIQLYTYSMQSALYNVNSGIHTSINFQNVINFYDLPKTLRNLLYLSDTESNP